MTVRLLVPTSYITVACVSARRYFDLDAVRTALLPGSEKPRSYANGSKTDDDHGAAKFKNNDGQMSNPAGAPPLDWWEDDRDTVRARLIDMMCPPRVCLTCGEPSRRIVEQLTLDSYRQSERAQTIRAVALADRHHLTDEHIAAVRAFGTSDAGKGIVINNGAGSNTERVKTLAGEAKAVLGGYFREFVMSTNATSRSGWSDCGHDNWRPGVAFDPFSEDGDPMTVRLLVGDVRDRISEIPDGSIDVVMCSPPFLALRNYGGANRDDREMGSERCPADFLDALLELTGEFRRVLTPHGSIAIELGDTYSGSGGAGGDYNDGGLRDGQAKFDGSAKNARQHPPCPPGQDPTTWRPIRTFEDRHIVGRDRAGWPLAKSLTLIPTLYPASLAYGRNLLRAPLSGRQLLALCRDVTDTMAEQGVPMTVSDLMSYMEGALEAAEEIGPTREFDRWRIRNVIVWARPNPPVGALGDKVRPATSYITVACTSAKRFFDLDAVRTVGRDDVGSFPGREHYPSENGARPNGAAAISGTNPAGAPPLDWWEDDDPTGHATLVLPTQPYPGAHYATWPETLASRLIRMMCPLRVCRECGEPSRRIVKQENSSDERRALATHLRERREALGLTVKAVAAHFPSVSGGLTGCVSNWEQATNVPTAEQWPVLKRILGISDEFDAVVLGERRWTEDAADYIPHSGDIERQHIESRVLNAGIGVNPSAQAMKAGRATKVPITLGWSDCGHDNWRPGRVLDPFTGSGTTLAVAQGLGRDATGIELYPANADLVRQRVGMFLTVDEGAA